MSGIELKFLGDFEVLRDGRPLPLPPSKKTRALLAYLSLNRRHFRREHLCELLWEIPDDPRGSLRWSLSKLRRLIDDDQRSRVIADRVNVGIDTDDVSIDVNELRALAGDGLSSIPLAELEAAAAKYRGNFLEGLEFSNFHDFHTWCVAEREQALRDHAALLKELTRRLAESPEQALPHARALVGLSPYDEDSRATLIRLLYAARQAAEAEEQYQLGLRMLKEAGVSSTGVLHAARRSAGRRESSERPAPTTPSVVARPKPSQRPLLGRDREIGIITETFDRSARSSRAGLMLLLGAPGMGKSRLLDALVELSIERDVFVLKAAASESDTIRPFALWFDTLRALDSHRFDDIFGGRDVANRERLFAGLSELLSSEAGSRPVVLIFDDIQWCDESSAAALHYILRMNRDKPVLGIVAARDGELADNVAVQQALRGIRRDKMLSELTLGPLPASALSTLIELQAPGLDSERLGQACAGNPLLAIELARAERDGSAGGSLADLVHERLSRFSITGEEVMRWAAVLRPHIDVATLVKVSGLDPSEVGKALELAETQAMLLPAARGLSFSHGLIAEAVYADISPLRRQVMHRRVAELLEQDTALDLGRASDLAHHATMSGDPGLAARAMISAGRLSLRFFANEDALSLARKGLQFAQTLGDAERITAEIELQDILLSASPQEEWADRAEMYADLAERALDHGALSHARLGYQMASYVRWAKGEWAKAREQSLQAERATRGGDSTAHIIGMAETAKCLLMLERDLSHADAILMEANALAERCEFVHHAVPGGFGMLRYRENRLDEAEELFLESRMLCKSAGDRLNEFLANEYLVMIAIQRGNYEEARGRSEQLVDLGEKIREGSERPFARALLGLCNYVLDGDDELMVAALGELRVADAKYRLAYTLTRAALVDCERGRKDSAVARAREALDYAEILERPTEMLLAHAVLACGLAAAGDPQTAEAHARQVERLQPEAAAWAGDITANLAIGSRAAGNGDPI